MNPNYLKMNLFNLICCDAQIVGQVKVASIYGFSPMIRKMGSARETCKLALSLNAKQTGGVNNFSEFRKLASLEPIRKNYSTDSLGRIYEDARILWESK